MDSGVSPNPWAPFDGYTRDCSKEICSLHCPEWCAMIFPPPPNKDDDSGNSLSPLIIALITALATAFLLLTYYTIISKFCRRGGSLRGGADNDDTGADLEGGSRDQEQWPPQPEGSRGLEEALIKSIAICKYSKRDGAVEGTDCSVCLSEFQEEESLRVLPKCNHAFHVPCIDKWLKAQSNCPLCRSNITPLNPHPSPPPASATAMLETAGPQNSPGPRSTSLQIHRPSDAVVMMVEDLESVRREEIVAVSFVAQRKTKTILEAHPRRDEERERGKASQNIIEILAVEEDEGSDSSSQHRGLRSIDHALRGDEEDEKVYLQIRNFCRSSSTGNGSTIRIEGQLEEEGDEEGSGNRITG